MQNTSIFFTEVFESTICEVFQSIKKASDELGVQSYVIGGFVRDFYLNNVVAERKDIDFVVEGAGIDLAQRAAKVLGVRKVNVFKRFGTAHFLYKGLDLEFVGARKESYSKDSRKPSIENGSIEDDQNRRDFTINAISWSLNSYPEGHLNDPFNGLEDLSNKIIKTPLDPNKTFDDDPLRMMRAVRFATVLDFDIESNTMQAIQQNANRLHIVSKERIITELNKIIQSKKPSLGFAYLLTGQLLHQFFPEMIDLLGTEEINGMSHKDNFWHTLQVLDNVAAVSDNLWLRWAAIMHDIAKPPTKKYDPKLGWSFHGHEVLGSKWTPKIFRRLHLPLDDRMRYVRKLVRLHLRPIALVDNEVTDSAIRRLIFDAGDLINDLMTLCRADITSKNPKKVKKYLKNFELVEQKIKEVEEKDKLSQWRPPIDGEEIMEILSLEPGPLVGKIKKEIEEAILNGLIKNDKQEALDFLNEIKSKYLNND